MPIPVPALDAPETTGIEYVRFGGQEESVLYGIVILAEKSRGDQRVCVQGGGVAGRDDNDTEQCSVADVWVGVAKLCFLPLHPTAFAIR